VIGIIAAVALAASGATMPSKTDATLGTVQTQKDTRAVPGKMNLQGYLTDASGNPINGVKSVIFKIYRDANLLWQEAQMCTVQTGLFFVKLGQVVPIPYLVFEPGTSCELDINVEGQPLTPRVEITSGAFAFRSVKSDSAVAIARPITPAISAPEIADAAVTMDKIHQSGATTGQVIRWSGTAWAPGQAGGVVGDSFIKNQDASAQNASFWINNGGQAQQFYGVSATADVPGVWGSGGSYCSGVVGDANAPLWCGVQGMNSNATGTGVIGTGNNEQGTVLMEGSGGAFVGTANGVFGYATDPSTLPITGGYFLASGPPDNYSYIAAWDESGYGYRCIGNGECAQGSQTRDGTKATFSLQAPEPGLEDRGRGQLIAGHARIELDPYFADCVAVSDQNPLDVFVQLNGDCNGVYVTSDTRGFDVYELKGGRGNVAFTYRVIAKTKGKEHVRFPAAIGPRPVGAVEAKPARLESHGK
jgi:hypothetical protein